MLRHSRTAEVSAVCLADSMKEMKERNGDRVLNVGFGAGIGMICLGVWHVAEQRSVAL